jgi:hypothetical protein
MSFACLPGEEVPLHYTQVAQMSGPEELIPHLP